MATFLFLAQREFIQFLCAELPLKPAMCFWAGVFLKLYIMRQNVYIVFRLTDFPFIFSLLACNAMFASVF